jgi:ketosteroid isomerase-like protein
MSRKENVDIVLAAFRAVERRDRAALNALYHPEVEFHWPPSLAEFAMVESWNVVQPTADQRRIDPRVVAASDREVVVLWRFRGVSPAGEQLDMPVLGLYEVRDETAWRHPGRRGHWPRRGRTEWCSGPIGTDRRRLPGGAARSGPAAAGAAAAPRLAVAAAWLRLRRRANR